MSNIEKMIIPEQMSGKRLDLVLAELFPNHSRSRLQKWLKAGNILLNGEQLKAKAKVLGGESLSVLADEDEILTEAEGENIDLDIIYDDEAIIVINKPAGLVVHPGSGNQDGTLLNALLFHYPELAHIPRAGIVHRLDKDTSGLLVVAKTLESQTHLIRQLQERSVSREYQAFVVGHPITGERIVTFMGRHTTQRTKMAVLSETNVNAKEAITQFSVEKKYVTHSKVNVKLETGRTHQIRVHLAYKLFPIVGDMVYGGRLKFPPNCTDELKKFLQNFTRQALHARKLGLIHPLSEEWMQWQVESPADMQLLEKLLIQHHAYVQTL